MTTQIYYCVDGINNQDPPTLHETPKEAYQELLDLVKHLTGFYGTEDDGYSLGTSLKELIKKIYPADEKEVTIGIYRGQTRIRFVSIKAFILKIGV